MCHSLSLSFRSLFWLVHLHFLHIFFKILSSFHSPTYLLLISMNPHYLAIYQLDDPVL